MIVAEQAWVISLPSRQDRRDAITADWPLDMELNFFNAIDHNNAPSGCLLSHLALLKSLDKPTLILEDDAVFADDFTLDLNPPGPWEVLWLGRQFILPPPVVSDEWALPSQMYRTHAYVARRPNYIYDLLRKRPLGSIDPALNQLPVKQYALLKATVGQRAGLSDITGLQRSEDMYWN